jgi:hypothetical protein
MRKAAILMLAAACCAPLTGHAWESDVHFGLTKWLALQAGFTEQQADTIALGNQRSDSGIMDSIELVLEYACLGKHADGAAIAATYHYASDASLPAPAERRTVAADSAIARRGVEQVLSAAAQGKSSFMLLKLGESLHLLQDSWAYQGTPDMPDFGDKAMRCSPELAWTAPPARGGWNSHRADIVKNWPADIRAMTAATYEVLKRYAPVAGQQRKSTDAAELMQQLDGFIAASTKADKRAWFGAHGIKDIRFLGMTTMPDGAGGFDEPWQGRHLAPLQSAQSRQYRVPEDAKQFFDRFFAAWLQSDKPESALAAGAHTEGERDLAARLKLWRLRDHGSAAEFAHVAGPYTKKQLQAIDRLTSARQAYVRYDKPQDAFFPLLEQGPEVSPLLPYVIHVLPDSDGRRIVAVTKLRHAPYDELGIVAEKDGDAWRAVRLISVVSH